MTGRRFSAVIADMIGVVPDNDAGLRARLEKIRRDAGFMAPELETELWWTVTGVMRDLCGDCHNSPCTVTGWVKQLCQIFTAEGTEHEHPERRRLREEGKL